MQFQYTVFPLHNVQGFWTKPTSLIANKPPTNPTACDQIPDANRALHPKYSGAHRIVVE